jgi:hypothetical protein
MPDCAKLVTFRDTTAEAVTGIPSQYSYFRLWRGLNYHEAFLIWLGSLLFFVVITRSKKVNVGAIPAFGFALLAIGLLMTASACLLIGFLPRYSLPMWQLLLLSTFIFIGAAADRLAPIGFKRAALN